MSVPSESAETTSNYVVIARRYRPQSFDDLIGQEHIAKALSGAITSHRVGHAYLFTGARGVGKTSAARIFAKALNCEKGPLPTSCNECEICQSISSGDDVDVLEIDGASNRGIDEIRQLRQNVNVLPSRARLKIYIIDEVHMLTREAFNALLKTLEEPPAHVKFIFCTTDPGKIPITILSRCQRYDFAGIRTDAIARQLRQIVDSEGISAEAEALDILARRAAGSMRDSQSLLEQLLAFAPKHISLDDIHQMLGTAGDEQLSALLKSLVEHNPAGVLAELNAAIGQGTDVAQLLEQLFGYLRDCLAAAVQCPTESFLYVSASQHAGIIDAANRLGIETLLAAMQILDQTLSRMRTSTLGRVLAELALVRICRLEETADLRALIAELQSTPTVGQSAKTSPPSRVGASPSSGTRSVSPRSGAIPSSGKKNAETVTSPVSSTPKITPVTASPVASHDSSPSEPSDPAPAPLELNPENAKAVWDRVVSRIEGLAGNQAKMYCDVLNPAPNRLVVVFPSTYNFIKVLCERPAQTAKYEQLLFQVTGQAVRVEFTLAEQSNSEEVQPAKPEKKPSPQQRLMEVANHPMIRKAGDLFGAEPTDVQEP